MNIIVNVSRDWAIGKGGGLLFHIREDMKFFKSKTVGNVVVMGRKTLDSLPGGRALPDRTNIVLTRSEEFSRDNVTVCHSLDELKQTLSAYPDEKIYMIGGESLYKLMLPYCGRAFVTKVNASVPDADSFMPDLDRDPDWQTEDISGEHEANGLTYRFVTYRRKTAKQI